MFDAVGEETVLFAAQDPVLVLLQVVVRGRDEEEYILALERMEPGKRRKFERLCYKDAWSYFLISSALKRKIEIVMDQLSNHALAPPQSMWKSIKEDCWDMKQYFWTLGYIMSSGLLVGSNCRLLK